MRYSNVAVPVLALLLAACGASENPSGRGLAANEAAVNEVTARMGAYVASIRAADMAALPDYFATDAIITETEYKATAPELMKFANDFLKTNDILDLQIKPTERVAYDAATVVYEFGHYTESTRPKGKTEAVNFSGNYAIRWIKDGDATWKIHRFITVKAPADSVEIAPPIEPIATAQGPELDAAAVTAQVTQAMADFVAKVNAGDPEGLLKAWADDFQLYEPEVQFMSKGAAAPAIQGLFASSAVTLALKSEQVFVHDDGRVAYQLGHYQETVTAKDGKSPSVNYHNTFMARWKRGADGGWVCDRFMATPLPKDAPH